MIERAKYLRHKEVMVINDHPVKLELENGQKFSSSSNTMLMTSLRTGRVTLACAVEHDFEGIVSTKVFQTYMDYTYFGEQEGIEKNKDYTKEICKRADLQLVNIREDIQEEVLEPEAFFILKTQEVLTRKSVERLTWYKLETHKDVFVSYRLKQQLDLLIHEIKEVKPKLIVITGKWGFFFLTGKSTVAGTQGNYKDPKLLGGLATFRASILQPHECFDIEETIVFPMYHTLNAIKMLNTVPIMKMDLIKLGYIYHTLLEQPVSYFLRPDKTYISGVDKEQILSYITKVKTVIAVAPTYVALDIETMFKSIIDCISIAITIDEGISIPFASVTNPLLWSEEDEVEVSLALFDLMQDPNCLHVGQNYSYDCQYYSRLWEIDVRSYNDTMIMHHCLYNSRPKDLAMLASLYGEFYTYWKDEIEATKETPEKRWEYNVKDSCWTLEVFYILKDIVEAEPKLFQDFVEFQQKELSPTMDEVMGRGIRIDLETKKEMCNFFEALQVMVEEEINNILGQPTFNIKSTPQKKAILSDLLGIKLAIKKKTGSETADKEALEDYILDYPELAPLLTLFREHGSLKVFVSTFLKMKLDVDNRARTQYKVAGTDTYRLASVKNAFGTGGNLQNIPAKGKIDLIYSEELYNEKTGKASHLELPNCKLMFLPDDGWVFFNGDFKGADAQVVAFDSNCPFLIDIFQDPTNDLYAVLASEYYKRKIEKWMPERTQFKAVAHASNYLGQAPTIARAAGLLVRDVNKVQKWYFKRCPEVVEWQNSIIADIDRQGYTENIFGARGWYLNKHDPTLRNKAVGWRGQSVIANLCNKSMVAINRIDKKTIQPLMNIHDAVAGQFRRECLQAPELIQQAMSIELPYEVPLTIGVDFDIYKEGYGSEKITVEDLRTLT